VVDRGVALTVILVVLAKTIELLKENYWLTDDEKLIRDSPDCK
jgi:hypothetical protein